jgi:hypothetical protein
MLADAGMRERACYGAVFGLMALSLHSDANQARILAASAGKRKAQGQARRREKEEWNLFSLVLDMGRPAEHDREGRPVRENSGAVFRNLAAGGSPAVHAAIAEQLSLEVWTSAGAGNVRGNQSSEQEKWSIHLLELVWAVASDSRQSVLAMRGGGIMASLQKLLAIGTRQEQEGAARVLQVLDRD